jgi:molybdate transport system substrate-binding protein
VRTLLVTGLALALAGCSTPAPQPAGSASTVTVFAAASLTEVFTQIAAEFEQQHPAFHIVLSFGASSTLAAQIVEGAPADVFAAASPATMATVTDAGEGSATPVTFATNRLEIAVPVGNPGAVTSVKDFARPELLIAVCAVEVPCGVAAAQALAGIPASIDTYEQDVKAVLSKVELGEVDAGLVYVTDVLANGKVDGIELDNDIAVDYPIVTISRSDAARAFVDFVLSTRGQAILMAAGFGAP